MKFTKLQRLQAEYNADKIDWKKITFAPICVFGIFAIGILLMIILQ